MSLGKVRWHSQLPDDDFITHMKHLRLSASNLKKAKQHFRATVSREEIETAKKPVIVKNTEIYCVSLSCVHVVGRGVKPALRPEMPLCTSDTTELCHWLGCS